LFPDAKAKENFGAVEENECLNKIVSLSDHVKKLLIGLMKIGKEKRAEQLVWLLKKYMKTIVSLFTNLKIIMTWMGNKIPRNSSYFN
jgi:hypothetical protein